VPKKRVASDLPPFAARFSVTRCSEENRKLYVAALFTMFWENVLAFATRNCY
jgi:hypothetical protein